MRMCVFLVVSVIKKPQGKTDKNQGSQNGPYRTHKNSLQFRLIIQIAIFIRRMHRQWRHQFFQNRARIIRH